MALYTLTGDTAGATGSLALTVLISATGAVVGSFGTVDGTVCLIMSVTGSAAASATSLSSLLLQRLPSGLAVGSAITTAVQTQKFSVVLGAAGGEVRTEAYFSDRDITNEIRSNLPDFLTESLLIKSLQKAHGIEAVRLSALSQQLQLDYFVDLSSEEALSARESELEIKVKPGQTVQLRRKRIKAQLQGIGVVTKQMFKQLLAERYYVCSIQEQPDEYKIVSTILSKRGVPDDIQEMLELTDKTLPAHLTHEFEFTWLPWSEIESVNLTCDQAESFSNWNELETAFLVPFVPEGGG